MGLCCCGLRRGGVIKRRLKKIGHYVTSMEFARQAQNDFIAANKALQKYVFCN